MGTKPLVLKSYTLHAEIPEHPEVELVVGPSSGNDTVTSLTLKQTDSGSWNYSILNGNVVIELRGDWERAGLQRALKFALTKLSNS